MALRVLRSSVSLIVFGLLLSGCALPSLASSSTTTEHASETSASSTAAVSTTTFTTAPDQQLFQLRAEYPTDRRDAPDFHPCYDIPGPLLQAVGADPDDYGVAHVDGSKDTVGCFWPLFFNPERFLLIEVLPYNEENEEFMAGGGVFTSVRGIDTGRGQQAVSYKTDRYENHQCAMGYMGLHGRVNLVYQIDGKLPDPYWPCGPLEQAFLSLHEYLPAELPE